MIHDYKEVIIWQDSPGSFQEATAGDHHAEEMRKASISLQVKP
jgi:hypothetical protein